jgi:hypothetical protein
MRDGRILVSRNTSRGDGSLVPDLYLWDVRRSSVHRVTHGAALTHPDPLPNGRSAIATRCRSGWCELVSVNLDDGTVRVIVEGGPDESYYRPRVSRDGARAAVSVHSRDGWRLRLVDLATGASRSVPGLENVDAYDGAWRDSTTLVASTTATGTPQIERVNLATGQRARLTTVLGAAVAPEPSPSDSGVWFLSLYSRGYDLRRVGWNAPASIGGAPSAALAPAAEVAPVASPGFATTTPTSPRPFGLTPRLIRWLPLPRTDADGTGFGLALTSRDILGRSALLLQGAVGDPAEWRGASVAGEWFGMRPAIRVDAFAATQRTSALAADVGSLRFDSRLAGGSAMLDGSLQYDTWAMRYRVGGSVAGLSLADPEAPLLPRTSTTRSIGLTDVGLVAVQRADAAALTESLNARGTIGDEFDGAFQRIVATAGVSLSGSGVIPISLASTYGRTNQDAPLFERMAIGGGPLALLPSDLLTQRLDMPALPSAISVNSSAFTYRASVDTRTLSFYWWGGSTAPAGSPFSVWQRVAGVEWTQSVAAIAMAGTPPARARIGVGESLDPPVRHRVRAYLSLVLDP